MARPICLITAHWADLPFETVCQKVSDWGFDGLEISCWGDHMEIDKAMEDDRYIPGRLNILEKYNLKCFGLSVQPCGRWLYRLKNLAFPGRLPGSRCL